MTPYELEVALGVKGRTWDGEYVLEFGQILRESGGEKGEESGEKEEEDSAEGSGEDPDQPVFSLVTGKYRQAKKYGGEHTPLTLLPSIAFCST